MFHGSGTIFCGLGELNRSCSYTEVENKGVNGLIFVF